MGLTDGISLQNKHNMKKPHSNIWVQVLHLLCWGQNCIFYKTGKQGGIQSRIRDWDPVKLQLRFGATENINNLTHLKF